MPKLVRPILIGLILAAASGALAGCGGDNGPDPSLSADEAATLDAKLQEIQDNVDVGSCLVAADRTDDLLADINELPDSVNQEVKNALVRGATNLKGQLEDPEKCQSRASTTTTTESTTEPTTTRETTTQKTQPQTTTTQTQTQPGTTTTQTQTQPNVTTTGGSGGIGPGGL